MTDQEIFQWGDRAEALINNPDYIALFEQIQKTLANDILSTNITSKDQREEVYQVYAGMRSFAQYLVGYVYSKEHLIRRQNEADDNTQEDSN